MAEAPSIKRRKRGRAVSEFDRLRRQAIELIERISGEHWTDYNLHDPGITILEQLIYALTELIHRSDFPVEDYLAEAHGSIDHATLALHTQAEIFPCRATSELDYRKLLLDRVPQAANVWLTPLKGASEQVVWRGLYRLSVKLAQGLEAAECDAVIEQLRDAYYRARNLGEDLSEIRVVQELEYELCADVEVSSKRRPSELLAEIYFACAQLLANSVVVTTYDELGETPLAPERLFDGPFTVHGFLRDADLPARREEFAVSTLFSAINALDGVDHIQQLYLHREGRDHYDVVECATQDRALGLQLPKTAEQVRVVLKTNGRRLNVDPQELRAKYDELNFRYQRSRSTPQDPSLLWQPPRGRPRQCAEYYSIQNHFPDIYGINAYGVPESAPPDVKARARQLKSYLLIFEQLLANFLANLDALPQLFSPYSTQPSSYALQPLTSGQINDLQALYPDNPFAVFSRIIERFDNYSDRKSRLLDYLLALYGERFTQNSLRHFNYYHSRDQIEQLIIDNKIAWLKSIVKLGRDRAAAADYRSPSSQDTAYSGVELRLRLLLSFESHNSRSLTMAILGQGLNLCHHRDYQQLKADSQELKLINIDELENAQSVPLQAPADDSFPALREILSDTLPMKNNLLSDSLLNGGIDIDRYQVGSLPANEEFQLIFRIDTDRHWCLGSYSDRQGAIDAANALRSLLIQLNQQSEGLHLVEHILLRPSAENMGLVTPEHDDFYSLQVSVIFPAWTTRCRDSRFRLLSEETLALNLPAHIYAHVFWLEFDEMYEFETLYDRWRDLRRELRANRTEIANSASQLVAFLRAHKPAEQGNG